MTTLPRQERNHMHRFAHLVREHGHIPTAQDIEDMKMTRAWCDAILEGESLEVADVYMKAFGRKVA